MSIDKLVSVLSRMAEDWEFREEVAANPDQALGAYGFTQEELECVVAKARDVASLERTIATINTETPTCVADIRV